jgi:hypothetical protein
MGKTTKELRARLRAKLSGWLEREVTLYNTFVGEVRETERAVGEGREVDAGATRWSDLDGIARIVLTHLADDDEIGLIASQIGERRPLKRILALVVGEEPSESWVVCRPGLTTPSLPQDFRSMATLLEVMAEAIVPEWIDHLAEDAPDPDGLTPDARAILAAMSDLRAFGPEARITQDMIRDKTLSLGEEIVGTRLGQAINLLKARGYVESKSGTATWLTARGRKTADMVKPPSNSK